MERVATRIFNFVAGALLAWGSVALFSHGYDVWGVIVGWSAIAFLFGLPDKMH